MYINEPNVPEDSNPLNWWRDNYSKYPSVAVVAWAFLGIPATSVASERVLFLNVGEYALTELSSLLTSQPAACGTISLLANYL